MEHYKNQVGLLVNVLPEVAKEKCFALHGGTAINLFFRNMPRLSVDIDLTYIPIEDRLSTFNHVQDALARIKENIKKLDRGNMKSITKLILKKCGTTESVTNIN